MNKHQNLEEYQQFKLTKIHLSMQGLDNNHSNKIIAMSRNHQPQFQESITVGVLPLIFIRRKGVQGSIALES